MTTLDIVMLLLTGFGAGLLGGFVGIGGSIIMIPAMLLLLGQNQHLYQAAAMIVNVVVALAGATRHLRERAIIGRIVRGMLPGAVIGVLLGVAASELPMFAGTQEVYLTGVFGLFLYLVAARELRVALASRGAPVADVSSGGVRWIGWGGLGTGCGAGFVGGLLGVGGGIIAVPTQHLVMRVPIRNAVANSAATMIALSTVGAAFKNYHLVASGVALAEPVRLALLLAPGAVIGAYVGGGLTHRLNAKYVRLVLVILLLLAGTDMVRRAIGP